MVVSIQYLRGLAAMMVVYHHSVRKVLELNPESPIPYAGFGNAGVDIFFVISGFIMWVTTVSNPQNPVSFWYRRIIRTVPLYWFFYCCHYHSKTLHPGVIPKHSTRSIPYPEIITVHSSLPSACDRSNLAYPDTRIINWGIPAVLLVIAALGLEMAGKIPQIGSLQIIGDASYSIYLSHILTIEVVEAVWEILEWYTDTLLSQLSFIVLSFGI